MSNYWMDKLSEQCPPQRQMPTPVVPQQPAPEADPEEPDMTEETWQVLNARQPATGSDFALVSANTRTWETNSRKVTAEGILGQTNGRKARAQLLQDIRSGKFTEAGRGVGALGDLGDARTHATEIADLTRKGAFDTDLGDLG